MTKSILRTDTCVFSDCSLQLIFYLFFEKNSNNIKGIYHQNVGYEIMWIKKSGYMIGVTYNFIADAIHRTKIAFQ